MCSWSFYKLVLPTLGSAPAVPCLFPCCLRWRKGGRKRDAEELALVCEQLFERGAGVRPGRRSEFTGKHVCVLLLLSGVKSVDELPLRISVRLSGRAWFSGLPRPAPFLPGRVSAGFLSRRVVGAGQPPGQEPAQQQPVGPQRSQQQLVRPELHRVHVRLLPVRVPPLRSREAEDHRVRPHAGARRTRYA